MAQCRVPLSFYLELAFREVENGAFLSPQENGVFDLSLAVPKVQERLVQAAAAGMVRLRKVRT